MVSGCRSRAKVFAAVLLLLAVICAGVFLILPAELRGNAGDERIVALRIGARLETFAESAGNRAAFYNADEFGRLARECGRDAGGAPGRAVPMPIGQIDTMRPDGGRFDEAVVFVQNRYSRFMKERFYECRWTFVRIRRCRFGLAAGSWPGDVEPGQRNVEEFFQTASELWNAAAAKDVARFEAARNAVKPSDVFVGTVDVIDGKIYLSGRQLEAMGNLLEEKALKRQSSSAAR